MHGQYESSELPARHNKRRSVALSCAECRRLKLKCSRIFPCSNCAKKGCAAICPDGSLTTGKGNRFVLANTEDLHDKILQLSNRVRHLEDALAESHASISTERHPLLSDNLLLIKRPLERETDAPLPILNDLENPPSDANDGLDALGSLSISQDGRGTFFGTTANSWYLLQNEGESAQEDNEKNDTTPPNHPWIHKAFPLADSTLEPADGDRLAILSQLPNAAVAQRTVSIYYQHAGWMYTPIPESDFYEDIFRRIYDIEWISSYDQVDAHRIAVMHITLALGTLMDLDRPVNSEEAARYYHLGRTALALESVLEEQSIPGIQALLLMCHYMFFSGIEEPRWVLMGLAVKLAHSVGLHRDSQKWNLGPEETQKRRSLMWEIYTYDSWQSLTFGRPPSFTLAHIDCPMAHGTTVNEDGQLEMSFAAWKHRFCSQCLSVVHDRAFSARTPNYKTLKELDKRVREFYLPPSLQVPGFGGTKMKAEVERPALQLTMQRYIAFSIREMTIFYMHRGFFARAIEDHPVDPLGSRFAPSVLAAYSSACSFVGLIESLFTQHPKLSERMWFLFTHVFSCAIVLGSIAVKSQMALAPSALSHLESAYILFSQVAENPRAAKVLPILAKLKERARICSSEYPLQMQIPPQPVKREVDELSALGGSTRLVAKKSRSGSHPKPSSPQSSGDTCIASSPGSTVSSPSQTEQVISYTHTPSPHSPWPGFDLGQVQNFSGFPSFPIPMVQEPQQLNDRLLMYGGLQQVQAGPQIPITVPDSTRPDVFAHQEIPYIGKITETPQTMIASGWTDERMANDDLNSSWQSFMAQFSNG